MHTPTFLAHTPARFECASLTDVPLRTMALRLAAAAAACCAAASAAGGSRDYVPCLPEQAPAASAARSGDDFPSIQVNNFGMNVSV
jgi:hypothetical protein